ncbi:Zn finger homeodomain 2 isoform X3 [Dermatophagoides pteronyssinus]|uniref:Zn finger homeodomain 2 isoform X3 n=1 Tax=Dermatophagoides pteronyssinus TaxID=6956 RepID=UPI003F6681FB
METSTVSSGNPALMISTTTVDATTTVNNNKSPLNNSLDTGQMRSSSSSTTTSPFTPNSFPLHKNSSSSLMSSSSSPPAAATAISPSLLNDTRLSPDKESSLTIDDQQTLSASLNNDGNESVTSSLSDVETFNGKIVYNPDGSAYIIEGPDSDGSEVEAEISQEGSIIDARGQSPNYGSISFPQIVSAFHISRSSAAAAELYSSLCGAANLSSLSSSSSTAAANIIANETKTTEVPVMHSYRVFTLRNKKSQNTDDNTNGSNDTDNDDDDNNNFIEKFEQEQEESVSLKQNAANSNNNCPSVPVKPILMCFICKLSFGYTKSFVAHAIGEHHLALNDDEKRILLSSRNISAIIQGVGKEKEPLLSFLQPKSSSPTPFRTLNQSQQQQQQVDAQRLLAVQMAAVASALSRSNNFSTVNTNTNSSSISDIVSPSSSSSPINQSSDHNMNVDDNNSVQKSSQSIDDDDEQQQQQKTNIAINDDNDKDSSQLKTIDNFDNNNKNINNSNDAASQFASELADLANLEKFAQAAAVAAAAQQQQQIDLHSIAAVMAAVAASNNNKVSGQNRTPSPGSMSTTTSTTTTNKRVTSPKSGSISNQHQTSLINTSPITNTSSFNNLGLLTTNADSKSISSLFNSQSDGDTSNLLATVVSNHVTRSTLSSSTTSNHPPLLMQHSRNSCKTLKCPKCNWHYKYQETLEIHMKEKHPENEMNCIYCLTNQPHPRLARGETYTCGYKPYRCDVCNYSTTTKGNLSIHMQSDKHINNVQELQNGNIPATATEHLLQSQALAAVVAQASAAAAVAANAATANTTSPITPTTSTTTTLSSSPVSTPTSVAAMAVAVAAQQQQQDAKNQQLQVKMVTANNTTGVHTPPSQTPPTTPTTQNSNNNNNIGSSGKQKATWRCDVCNYETNVARNLRIHMTSEKHTHNIMVLKQNVTQMQQLNAIQQAGILSPELLQLNPGFFAAAAAAAAAAAGMNNNTETNTNDNNNASMQPEVALADMAYNHALLMMASQQQQRTMAALMQQQQLQQQQQQQTNESKSIMPNGLQATFDMEHTDPNVASIANSVPFDENCHLYHCCVCGNFSSDSIDALNQHIQCDRTRTREDEVLMSIGGSYICKLCSYKTNLKANFQLHCKTDKHLQRLQHVNHIKEGVSTGEHLKLKLVQMSNPIQVLRCNVCNYYTNSIHKLQLHCANPRHDVYSRIFNHLQISEFNISGNKYFYCTLCSTATATKIQLIQHLNSFKHVRNENLRQLKQQQSTTATSTNTTSSSLIKDSDEEIREMFVVKELRPGDKIIFDNNNDDDYNNIGNGTTLFNNDLNADPLMLKNVLMEQFKLAGQLNPNNSNNNNNNEHESLAINCPFCPYSNTSELHVQMHILTAHHQPQSLNDQQQQNQQQSTTTTTTTKKSNNNTAPPPTILCPLCQEPFNEKNRLECHLVEIHNVNKEGVQRLMLLVDTSELDKYSSSINNKKSISDVDQMNRDNQQQQQNDDDDDGNGDDDDDNVRPNSSDSNSKLLMAAGDDEMAMMMSTMMDTSNMMMMNSTLSSTATNNMNALLFEHLICPICNRMYLNLEELFNHMTADSHMKQTNSGQYQCWRNGCGQTFKTITSIQQHFKEQHFAKCIKMMNNSTSTTTSSSSSNLASNASVSDRHVYKYRCTQCSLAFKTFEKLQLHSQYHLIRAATQCVICGRSFRSVESLQKHVESSHSNLNDDELEQYKANLINNQLLFALGRNGGILDPSTTELLKKESCRNENENDESMDMENGAIDLAANNNKDHDDNNPLLDSIMEQTSGSSNNNLDNVSNAAVNIFNGNVDNASLEDYLNSQHLAEDNYNDPNRRFKCHRCKVAFTRQSYLTSHNKTLLHRKGEKMSYPMEKYLDPNRPFKCEICKESFTQKNILLVHYNSVSHLHKLKQSMKESSAAVAASVAASNNANNTSPTSTISESMNEDDNNENKLYKCNLCKVSYSMASSLHNHLRSSLHHQRTSKLHELAQSGQLDLSLPLIEPLNHNDMNINNNSSSSKINSTSVETSAKTSSPSPNMNKFPEMLMANLNEQQQQQQALAFQQAALNLAFAAGTNPNQTGSTLDTNQTSSIMNGSNGGGSQSPFTCVKCGASFISQEAQIQHQQLCGLFGNITNVANMQLFAAQQQAKQQQQTVLSKLSNLQGPLYKNKPQLYKHLLETWGFEIVMQFNESNQKNKKSDDCTNKDDNDNGDDEENLVDNDDQQQQSKNNENDESTVQIKSDQSIEQSDVDDPNQTTTNNKQEENNSMTETIKDGNENVPPEINKCQCEICFKEFSSIWVLKAHREEIHKDVIPLDVVESFADEYRNEYDRKFFVNGNVDDDEDDDAINEDSTANNSNNDTVKCNKTESKRNNNVSIDNPSTQSHHESMNQSANSIGESSNMITADQMNQLAAAAGANNLAQLLPNLSPNATPAEIAAANQMAAHIQFSQLLMGMGLAGMAAGMPMPPGMNVPFAAAAAMGIPPQLIPVMMADPMMAAAAAFNNPALAAAAAAAQLNQVQQQQQVVAPNTNSTPGTPSPVSTATSTTPVMPIQTQVNNSQTLNQQTAAVAAAAAAAASSVSQQQKRARTRISDEQLKVLRQYFDINNSPTEEQLIEMSQKSGLPMKVIKHWFRNTLFKERQRNKDSPYNFNNPPSTFLNIDEYEKTGETKVFTLDELKKTENNAIVSQPNDCGGGGNDHKENANNNSNNNNNNKDKTNDSESECDGKNLSDVKSSSSNKDTDYATSDDEEIKHRNHSSTTKEIIEQQQSTLMEFSNNELSSNKQQLSSAIQQHQQQHLAQDFDQLSKTMSYQTNSPPPSESSMSSACESINNNPTSSSASLFAGLTSFNHSLATSHHQSHITSSSPLQFALDAAQRSQLAVAAAAVAANQSNMMTTPPPNVSTHSSSGKRANRTRFTDYQIKVLQEFFESNAYPKDDDLEYLSKLLNLSPRVIVVWFQNARQKARKVYENQPPTTPVGEDDGSGRFQRTPGLNYQCKKCLQVFQRYYELIKHQKSSCFKDENPLAAQIRMAAEARAQASSPNVSTSRDSATSTPIDCTRSSTATPEKSQLNNLMTSPNSVSSPSSLTGNSIKTSPIINNNNESQTFRCDKCPLVFNRLDLWRDHQIVHIVNSNLFQATANPFGLIQQLENQHTPPPPPSQQQQQSSMANSPQPSPNSMLQSGNKRKFIEPTDDDDDDDESRDFDSMSGNGNNSNSSDQTPRDKRLRTTILPEQLDYLYQKYQLDSNPSRKMLESIAKEVGLKKRVVQVWFQNTRARERKGQFRAHQQVIHKRCPFCRALFKARSALESHLATRHADQYTKGDINIDNLPDGDPSEDGDISDIVTANNNADGSQMADVMKRYEDSFKKYLDELNIQDIANIFVHLQEKMAVNCPQSSPSR